MVNYYSPTPKENTEPLERFSDLYQVWKEMQVKRLQAGKAISAYSIIVIVTIIVTVFIIIVRPVLFVTEWQFKNRPQTANPDLFPWRWSSRQQAPLWTCPQTELCWWRGEFSQALTLIQSLSFYDTHSFIVPRTINAAPPQAATEKYLRGPQSHHISVPPNYSATVSIQTALLRSVFVKTEAPIK